MELRINDISFAYNGTPVLDHVSLAAGPGDILTVIGPNGSGKTTLLKCMNGKLAPKSGAVLVDGRLVSGMRRRDIARAIAVVPQVSTIAFPFTVRDLVMMGRYAHKGRFEGENDTDREVVERCLACTGIAHMAARPVTALSGGEYQKVIVARALAQEPRILLLDEVTLHLDINRQIEILELIRMLGREQGLAVVIVLHDLGLAARYGTGTVMLKRGRIVAAGCPEEVITAGNIRGVYGIEAEIGRSARGGFMTVTPVSIVDDADRSRPETGTP